MQFRRTVFEDFGTILVRDMAVLVVIIKIVRCILIADKVGVDSANLLTSCIG